MALCNFRLNSRENILTICHSARRVLTLSQVERQLRSPFDVKSLRDVFTSGGSFDRTNRIVIVPGGKIIGIWVSPKVSACTCLLAHATCHGKSRATGSAQGGRSDRFDGDRAKFPRHRLDRDETVARCKSALDIGRRKFAAWLDRRRIGKDTSAQRKKKFRSASECVFNARASARNHRHRACFVRQHRLCSPRVPCADRYTCKRNDTTRNRTDLCNM